jgi:hypothetical protein
MALPVVGILLIHALRALRAQANQPKPDPICVDCTFAHIQWSTNGRRDLLCTYGHKLRPIGTIVAFCTSYLVRQAPRPRGPVGFVQIAPAGEEPKQLTA